MPEKFGLKTELSQKTQLGAKATTATVLAIKPETLAAFIDEFYPLLECEGSDDATAHEESGHRAEDPAYFAAEQVDIAERPSHQLLAEHFHEPEGLQLRDDDAADQPWLQQDAPTDALPVAEGDQRQHGFAEMAIDVSAPRNSRDALKTQLPLARLRGREAAFARILIEEVDDDGFLRADLNELAEHVGLNCEAARGVLKTLQGFEPTGVFARTVSERLRLLWEDDGSPQLLELIDVIETLPEANQPRATFARHLGVTAIELDVLLQQARGRPYFIDLTEGNAVQAIRPDIFLEWGDAETFTLRPCREDMPTIRRRKDLPIGLGDRQHKPWLDRQAWREATLREKLEYRETTIMEVAKAVVEVQFDHLRNPTKRLKPLSQKEVARHFGLADSTISRAVRDRYLMVGGRLVELQTLFADAVDAKCAIQDIVAGEKMERPFSDEKISILLQRDYSLEVAKRTVTKYRQQLGIPNRSRRRATS